MSVFNKQASNPNLWNDSGGYLSFVQDARNERYMRFYVGQSFVLRQRIPYHMHQIGRGSTKSLHYFLLAMGEGHRYTSFLKLWELPACSFNAISEQGRQAWDAFFNNILEMAFSRVFQSLPVHTLETYFGPSKDGYAGNGLNVVSPLLQNTKLSQMVRDLSTLVVTQSQDADIRAWQYQRHSQVQKRLGAQGSVRSPPLTTSQCHDVLKGLFDGDDTRLSMFSADRETDVEAWEMWKDGCITTLQISEPEGIHYLFPYGKLSTAKVGFIFDDAYFIYRPDNEKSSDQMRIPSMLDSIGFNEHNSLIWNCRFYDTTDYESKYSHSSQPQNDEGVLALLNRELIGNSCLKVIFCCGADAMHTVSRSHNSHSQREVRLGPFTFKMWVETLKHERLFIYSPELASSFYSADWTGTESSRIEVAINFACEISNTPNIHPGEIRNTAARILICRQARKEQKSGAEIWTAQTLPLVVRIWLSLKGFRDDEAIQQLETMTGNLTRGLIALLHVLPHRPEAQQTSQVQSRELISRIPRAHLQKVATFLGQLRQGSAPMKPSTPDNSDAGGSFHSQNDDMQLSIKDASPVAKDRIAHPRHEETGGTGADATGKQLQIQIPSAEDIAVSQSDRSSPVAQHQHDPASRHLLKWKTKLRFYEWSNGRSARALWKAKHKTEGYSVRIPKPRKAQRASGSRPLNFGYMTFNLPSTFQPAGDYMTIHPEFSATGTRHEHVYAVSSGSSGRAQQLALRLEGQRKDGTTCSSYATSVSPREVRAAEDFASCLLEGVSIRKNS